MGLIHEPVLEPPQAAPLRLAPPTTCVACIHAPDTASPPRYAPPTLVRPPPSDTASPSHGNQPPASPPTAVAAASMMVAVFTPGHMVVPRLLPALRVRGGDGGTASGTQQRGKKGTREPRRSSPTTRKGSQAGACVRRQGVGDEGRRQPPTMSAEDQRWSALIKLTIRRLAPPGRHQLALKLLTAQGPHDRANVARPPLHGAAKPLAAPAPPTREYSKRTWGLPPPPSVPPSAPTAQLTTPNFPQPPPPPPLTLRLPPPESLHPRTSMCGRSFFAL